MSEPQKQHKPNIVTIVVALVIVGAMFFYFFTFQVRVMEHVVMTTFGSPTHNIDEPGLYWKWPYPFQRIYKYDTRLSILDTGQLEQIMTKDHKSIIISTYVAWKIADPQKFFIHIGEVAKVANELKKLIRSQTDGVIKKHPFSHLISHRREQLHFDAIEDEIRRLINTTEGGAESFGIHIEEFGIKRLVLPQSVSSEVFSRMREERNGEAERLRSEGEGKSQKIRSEAESLKEKILIKAQAEAKKIRGQGVAAAAKFYKVFAQEHKLVLWLRKLEALESILGSDGKSSKTLIFDAETMPFDLFREGFSPLIDKAVPEDTGDSESPQETSQEKAPEERRPDDEKTSSEKEDVSDEKSATPERKSSKEVPSEQHPEEELSEDKKDDEVPEQPGEESAGDDEGDKTEETLPPERESEQDEETRVTSPPEQESEEEETSTDGKAEETPTEQEDTAAEEPQSNEESESRETDDEEEPTSQQQQPQEDSREETTGQEGEQR